MSTINFNFVGPTYKNCDPSGDMKAALGSAKTFAGNMQNLYGTVFGLGSSMYKSLAGKLSSIMSSSNAYSQQQQALQNSQTLNTAAGNAQAVNRSIGEHAARGGTTPGIESGVVQATRAAANTQILNNASNQENQNLIEGQKMAIGERDKAISESAGLGSQVFAPTMSAAGELNAGNKQYGDQAGANQNASNSWMGVVGGIAKQAIGSYMGGIGGALSAGGGGNSGGGSDVSGSSNEGTSYS